MSWDNKLIIFLALVCGFSAFILVFELGIYLTRTEYSNKITEITADHRSEVQSIKQDSKVQISKKEEVINGLVNDKNSLTSEVSELNTQVAGLMTTNSSFPFSIPSTGTVGSQVSTYDSVFNGYVHKGVDMWTSLQNGGAINTHQGNPVYSACSGTVESFQPDNGGVTIRCDLIPSTFDVPARKVYTYYGHMGNAITKENYIYIKIGERVKKGQFIGYQGDLSQFTPNMRNVHLHFSIFSGTREGEGSQDPCLYIGGECKDVGYFFTTEAK